MRRPQHNVQATYSNAWHNSLHCQGGETRWPEALRPLYDRGWHRDNIHSRRSHVSRSQAQAVKQDYRPRLLLCELVTHRPPPRWLGPILQRHIAPDRVSHPSRQFLETGTTRSGLGHTGDYLRWKAFLSYRRRLLRTPRTVCILQAPWLVYLVALW